MAKSTADSDDDFQVSKRRKLQLSGSKERKKSAAVCFVETVSDSDLAKMEKGHIPANTDKNTQWAMNNVRQWLQHRNRSAQEKCPEGLFSPSTPYPV